MITENAEKSSRPGRGKAKKTLDLIDTAAEILREIQPATVRAVCYRLFAAGLIPNMGKNATGKVSKQLVFARENGLIPWNWIVDETRHAERVALWNDIDERIKSATNSYRRDNWQEQPNRVEVWSEKGTVRGTVWPVLTRYGVTFRVLHGFGSATVLNYVARSSTYSPKPVIALYVGDFDPSGLYMSEVDLPRRIGRYGGEVSIQRIALTQKDVAPGTNITHFDAATKSGDSRHEWFVAHHGNRCFELDAMSPVVLRQRVESAIRSLMDLDTWNHALAIEQAEVKSMRRFADQWKESISRQVSKYPTDGSAAK